jgi:short-subunit dehydrogenase
MAKARHRIGPGTTAVVTGAGGGLGQALCRALEERGAQVVATDRAGVGGVDRVLDVTDAGACRALAEQVAPAIWVNNAGVLGASRALDQSDEEVRRVVEVNLLGVVNGTRAAARSMLQRGHGVVLNIGSLSAWNPTPGLAVYAATKHGVRAYSGAVAAELRGTGVRVACLCPDGIWTPMLQSVVDDEVAAMPFSGGRLLEPGDVAQVALDLIEARRLLVSLPTGRAVFAKISGLWPGLGVRTYPMAARAGRRGQARRREAGRSLGDPEPSGADR